MSSFDWQHVNKLSITVILEVKVLLSYLLLCKLNWITQTQYHSYDNTDPQLAGNICMFMFNTLQQLSTMPPKLVSILFWWPFGNGRQITLHCTTIAPPTSFSYNSFYFKCPECLLTFNLLQGSPTGSSWHRRPLKASLYKSQTIDQ